MACLCDAVVAGGKVSGRPCQGNHYFLPTRSCFSLHRLRSHRNGISSITLSHIEKVPRGLPNYNPVIAPTFREGRVFSGSGNQARFTIEIQELKLWVSGPGLQCGRHRLVVYFLPSTALSLHASFVLNIYLPCNFYLLWMANVDTSSQIFQNCMPSNLLGFISMDLTNHKSKVFGVMFFTCSKHI